MLPPCPYLLLLSSLLLPAEGEHEPSVLYGGRLEHEGSTAQKHKGYYEHIDLSEASNTSKEGISELKVVKHDKGRIQNVRKGWCFSCSTLSDKEQVDPNNICYNISLYNQWKTTNPENDSYIEQCNEDQKYCQVKRVDYKVDNMDGYAQWSLTRSCEKTCEPFCVTMGGRTKVTYCTSCCRWDGGRRDPKTRKLLAGDRSDYCNTGNLAPKTASSLSMVLFLGTLMSLLQ